MAKVLDTESALGTSCASTILMKVWSMLFYQCNGHHLGKALTLLISSPAFVFPLLPEHAQAEPCEAASSDVMWEVSNRDERHNPTL